MHDPFAHLNLEQIQVAERLYRAQHPVLWWFVDEISEDDEIVEVLCAHWSGLSEYVRNALELLELGVEIPSLDLECREAREVDFRLCAF